MEVSRILKYNTVIWEQAKMPAPYFNYEGMVLI